MSDEELVEATSSLSLTRLSGDQVSTTADLVALNSANNNYYSSLEGGGGSFTIDFHSNSTRNHGNINCNQSDSSLREPPQQQQQQQNDGNSNMNLRAQTQKAHQKPTTTKGKGSRSSASAAILEAKKNAQQQKRSTRNSNPKTSEDIIFIMKDHLQPARDMKGVVRGPTGVIYDLEMLQHHCLWDPTYPEKPERMSAILNRCEQLGLLQRCIRLDSRHATEEEVKLLHSTEQLEKLKEICKETNPEILEDFSGNYDSIYVHPSTYNLSLLSVGCTMDLVNSVLAGKIQNGMAIIRPPGHHAMKSEYCGYCYFNNVAIAAQHALNEGKASKILIVDFDVHHGQATQQMFYNDNRVLYFSTHRYEHGKFWPNLKESNFNYIGSSSGIGFNCNVPLNKTGLGNADFLTVWHQLLLPMAYEWNPDLVLVSAGYDSLTGDEKGEMEMTPQCCPHLLWPLLGLAEGKVAVVLEGGYCIESLAEGAALTLRALLGDPCPLIPKTQSPSPVLVESLLNATYMLRPFWNFLVKQRVGKKKEEEIDGKEEEEETFVPSLDFQWTEEKPLKYETRNLFPPRSPQLLDQISTKLNALQLTTNLKVAPWKVGLVYDDMMLRHRNIQEPHHPETPERISNIYANHVEYGLVDRCLRVNCRPCTEEELLVVHSKGHADLMKSTATMKGNDLAKLQQNFNSIFFNKYSYSSALLAAGSVVEIVNSVINCACQSGLAIVRPPGHHAEEDYPNGFCLFNNVAIAAKLALNHHGLSRILIVDWDVHHGNGIQRMFEDDPRVLYISIHRYDNATFFPCSTDANFDVVGRGKGVGYNINVPWNGPKMGDTEYMAVFTNVVMPVAYQFSPELVIVSAGFDAAKGDPLGGCNVTPECYGHMTHLLSSLANGKLVVVLEGGYNLTSIAYSMVMCSRALLGDPLPRLSLNKRIHGGALKSIQNVLSVHADYWSALKPFRQLLSGEEGLIPLGNYEGNFVVATPSSNTSSPDRHNCSDLTLSPVQLAAEAITMTLVVGDGGGGAAGGTRKRGGEHSVVMSNDDDASPAALYPASWCPHLEDIQELPMKVVNTAGECDCCGLKEDNWICLVCYKTLCSRYANKHMVDHFEGSGHPLALSFADLSVWCYKCECYVFNEKFKQAFFAAHLDKFGEEPPSNFFSAKV